MKRLTLLFAVAAVLASCGDSNQKKNDHEHDHHDGSEHHEVKDDPSAKSIRKNDTTRIVLDAYLNLNTALTEDHEEAAQKRASELVVALDSFQTLVGRSGPLLKKFQAEAQAMSTADIKTQREHFAAMTRHLKKFLNFYGADRMLYTQHCPMYGEKGGSWISEKNEVVNPLFGSQMLHCGEVTEQLVVK